MKRSILLFLIILFGVFLMPMNVDAGRGCCSHHGGVVGCGSNGKQLCADDTYSPSCRCTPPAVYGCTDSPAKNYNYSANKDDGSCKYYIFGCTDKKALNYNEAANKDDGSCEYDEETTDDDSSDSSDDASGFNTLLTIGGIGAGVQSLKKKKK